MRTCSRCGQEKAIEEFPERKLGSGRRHGHCRACKARYQAEWYARNKERHKANVAKIRKAEFARNRQILREAKDVPCTDCRRRYPPYVMDFDHVRGRKRGNVSLLAASLGSAAVVAEIQKCEVVCSNCHRIRTHLRRRGRWPRAARREVAEPAAEQLSLAIDGIDGLEATD